MKKISLGLLLATNNICHANSMPADFVYLRDIDPTIIQDVRYATAHNFMGRPIKGYAAAECILTRAAAQALTQVQKELLQSNLSLKVYDCYRPQMAVDDFIAWSKQAHDQKMKAEFYPRVNKADFFTLGYVAAKSGHSRGSTVDLTIVPLAAASQTQQGHALIDCTASYTQRFADDSIDMGTNFDCMDELSHNDNRAISTVAYYNRQLLRAVMEAHGFMSYQPEWWHFTLKAEPYSDTYFNFPISAIV